MKTLEKRWSWIGDRYRKQRWYYLETARKYAECGVDFISSGALTHSVYNMDLSLKAMHE
jgi:hypothetical protein